MHSAESKGRGRDIMPGHNWFRRRETEVQSQKKERSGCRCRRYWGWIIWVYCRRSTKAGQRLH